METEREVHRLKIIRDITPGAIVAFAVLLVLLLIVGGGNLWATYMINNSTKQQEQKIEEQQAAQGRLVEQRLCTTLARQAALIPPSGDPTANPSRDYEVQLHNVLAQLGPDVGCKLAVGYTTGKEAGYDNRL